MKKPHEFTTGEILAAKEPEILFSNNEAIAKSEYRELVKIWHPDTNKDTHAQETFERIMELYTLALQKMKDGKWETPGLLEIVNNIGGKFRVRYHTHTAHELGDVYLGNSLVTYRIRKEFEDLYRNYKAIVTSFRFEDTRMKDEMKDFFPQVHSFLETPEDDFIIVVKEPEWIRLTDLVEVLKKIDPRHIAWILSRMYGLLSYCKYSNLTHNDLSLDSIFINPATHRIKVLGGWWYAKPIGEKMVAVPARTLANMPPDVLSSKRANARVDLTLAKLTARELLGHKNIPGLYLDKDLKTDFIQWLLQSTSGEVGTDFTTWNKVIESSFGGRRFTKFDIHASAIYPALR